MKQEYKKYLPSKKFLISAGIIIGVILLVLALKWFVDYQKARQVFATLKVGDLENPAEIDTDNDGLFDWEEALWNTDPKNPDTDANGVPDGRQVDAIRAQITAEQGTASDLPPEELTETDKLARDIYTSLAIASQGGELSEADSLELQQKIIEYIVRRVGGFREYGVVDLTVRDNSPQNIAAYAEFLTDLNSNYTATQDQLFKTVKDLAQNIATPDVTMALGTRYLNLAEQIKEQPVPQKVAQQHADLTNAFIRLGTILQGVAAVEDDPLTAFVNGIGIQDALNTLATAFGNVGRVLAK